MSPGQQTKNKHRWIARVARGECDYLFTDDECEACGLFRRGHPSHRKYLVGGEWMSKITPCEPSKETE